MNARRLVTAGGSGFLGRLLGRWFAAHGWTVVNLTRSPRTRTDGVRDVGWDGVRLGDWAAELDGAEALLNLSGRSVDCRYNARHRREIMDSRVDSTRVLGEAVNRCVRPPDVWMNASTATLYRHTTGPAWDEGGEIGPAAEARDAFSVEVGEAWERTFDEARTPGTRKVLLRMAMVLGTGANSVFPVLRRLVRFGLGGSMGGGRQYVSWIHETDFRRAIEYLIGHTEIAGPVNLTAPHPETNADMMRQLRRVCGVPIGLPATEWMLELGAFFLRTETELILKSRRVVPGKLLRAGFEFEFPRMEDAFRELAARGPGV